MPRPDAGCIWTSFQSSGKRHLLLTGGRGSGKTTLLNALAARLAEGPLPGVTTWAEPGREVRLQENGSGAWAAVGVFDPGLPGPENRTEMPQPQETISGPSVSFPLLSMSGRCLPVLSGNLPHSMPIRTVLIISSLSMSDNFKSLLGKDSQRCFTPSR